MNISVILRRAAAAAMVLACTFFSDLNACTGISFTAKDGSFVLARTAEWGGSDLHSRYVVVPRGYRHVSLTADGGNGLIFTGKYGYVGVAANMDQFVLEGLNEKGLSAGLFFFPGYGQYPEYDSTEVSRTVPDMQVVSWILSGFSTVQEVIDHFDEIIVTMLYPQSGTSHWRVGDPSGRQVVIEITGGKTHIYENTVGVLTNSPDFPWHVPRGRDSSFAVCTCRLLSGHRTAVPYRRGDGNVLLPDSEQFRHTDRGGASERAGADRHSRCHAVYDGGRYQGTENVLAHLLEQHHPLHRPE